VIFDEPIPFQSAEDILFGKKTAPTGLSTNEIRTQWSKDARSLSLYAARTNKAAYLEEVRAAVAKMQSGEWNAATARQHLQLWCDKFGYTPEGGFPGEGKVPPALKDTLRDLSSDGRVDLVIQTISRLAANTAFCQSGMEPDNLYNWPAWELVRIYPRQHPRGSTGKEDDLGWPRRWNDAGMSFVGGRMIALKTNPGWERLGDSGIFEDGTDSSVPPFWFNSGGGLEEVGRKECVSLGLISPTEGQKARRVSLVSDLFNGHPERATLGDLKSSRQEILDALAELKGAA
jgi:hypothetical protein